MKNTFKNMAAQGDLLLRRIDKLPEGLIPAKPENGQYILAHSETGHHHVVLERSAQLFIDKTNQFIAYLNVSESCEIKHLRSYDTHDVITSTPGIYEARRQQEYTPRGLRPVKD